MNLSAVGDYFEYFTVSCVISSLIVMQYLKRVINQLFSTCDIDEITMYFDP